MKVIDNELLLYDRIKLIQDIMNRNGQENFYVSFSGGKDSTVLSYLVDEALPGNTIPRVFINTGIEYIDLVKHVKDLAKIDSRIVIYDAGVNIKQMLSEKGYPFKSKEHSKKLGIYQRNGLTKAVCRYLNGERLDETQSRFMCPKSLQYQFQNDFNIRVSESCCDELKKKVSKRYEKESGRNISIVGLRMGEGDNGLISLIV